MTLLYEELGVYPAARALAVVRAIHQQLERERVDSVESEVEAFYQGLRDQAAERRRLNPGAYVLPPGHKPLSAGTLEECCPWCGQAMSSA
jgi:hypothetical protein